MPKLTDAELAALTPQAAYEAGWDFAIERMREDRDRNYEFIQSIHAIIRQMGFTPLGLSYEQEILHALRIIAEQRARD